MFLKLLVKSLSLPLSLRGLKASWSGEGDSFSIREEASNTNLEVLSLSTVGSPVAAMFPGAALYFTGAAGPKYCCSQYFEKAAFCCYLRAGVKPVQ